MAVIQKCPICESSDSSLLYTQKFAEHFEHNITACNNCHFVFVSNAPSQKYYDKYYEVMSKYEHGRDEDLHNKYFEIAKKFTSKNSSVLDIGCSTGNLLHLYRQEGYTNLLGVDPSPRCKTVAEREFHISVETATISSFKPRKKFDYVMLAMVLEHLKDVRSNVTKLEKLIAENGYLFISVPNAAQFHAAVDEPFYEFSTEHINFFSPTHLFLLMKRFTCVHMETDERVIYSVWQKGNSLKKTMSSYISMSKKRFQEVKKVIDNLPSEILVWGSGALTQKLLNSTNLEKKIFKFIDRNKHLIGTKLNNVDIIAPSDIKKYDYPILISSFRFRDEIKKEIKNLKLKNKVITF